MASADPATGPGQAEGFVEEPAPGAGVVEGGPPAPPTSSTLRLRGLPFSSTDADVKTFFAGFDVQQVVICRRNGRSTGEGYVELSSPEEAGDAITKLHRQTLGPRYIEVFESSEADLATAKSLSVDRMRGFVVRCRGLPYTATATDVMNFFGEETPVVRGVEGVVFTYAPDGRPTGECYVEFQTEEAQRDTLKKHKEAIGSRYIELFVSTKVDMFQAIQQNRMILGYSNRRRWMQQQGFGPGGMGGPPHHQHQHPGYMPHGPPHGGMHQHPMAMHQRPQYGMQPRPQFQPGGRGGGMHPGGPQRRTQQYGQVEEVTEMMAGFSMGSQQMQMMGPGGSMMQPGGPQPQQPQQQQRYAGAYLGGPGRGGPGRGMSGPYQGQGTPGRGGPGAVMGRGGGGMGAPHGPPAPHQHQHQQMVAVSQPMAPPRQTAQVVPVGGPGQTVIVQDGGTTQYIIQQPQQGGVQYDPQQQQWAGQHMIAVQPGQAPGQGGQAMYATSAAQAGQQPGIQGMAPGTYTLTAIQVPAAPGNTSGYAEYPQIHGLQALDMQQGGSGLQAVDMSTGLQIEVSALGAGGEMLLSQGHPQHRAGGRYDGQAGM